MAIIHASIGRQHYQTTLRAENNTYTADEPEAVGGSGEGFNPTELLASSLAACTCMTLRMYADRKQWPLEGVEVKVVFTRNAQLNTSEISREISLSGELSETQRSQLLAIANSCYIHRTLTNPITISTALTTP